MDQNILRDKIYACWLGKNIGGTLGAPIEGRTDFMDIKWFPELGEKGCIPNDDLDLQLLNLHALEHFGASLRAEQLGREWVEHNYFPVDEYGYAVTNLRRGLRLPLAVRSWRHSSHGRTLLSIMPAERGFTARYSMPLPKVWLSFPTIYSA